ncbi:hypothetical protein [Mitsuaria sp. GD03876]|uniref:hypothetical protein n=1 Tax=Mitsuaria sp. GD03876 TaxID=2975399 RepID=UPI00244AD983|nr:hypothetical protein [Mitsuaria sp. GD03876]MDH0868090.1 hypothetical protein [Mitsuaria sp. GD03876]
MKKIRMKIDTQCPADQVLLPVEVIQHLGLQPGESIDVDFWSNGTVYLHLERRSSQVDSVAGILRDRPRGRKKPVSLKEIKRAIEDGWAGRR